MYRIKLKYLLLHPLPLFPSTSPSTKIFHVSVQSFSYTFIFINYQNKTPLYYGMHHLTIYDEQFHVSTYTDLPQSLYDCIGLFNCFIFGEHLFCFLFVTVINNVKAFFYIYFGAHALVP